MPTPSYNVRDFIGKPFGAWTVIGRGKPDNQGRPRTRTIYEWSDLYSIKAATLYRRLRSGWSAERTLCTPPIGNERVRRTQKD